jgi:hypothetical protein
VAQGIVLSHWSFHLTFSGADLLFGLPSQQKNGSRSKWCSFLKQFLGFECFAVP